MTSAHKQPFQPQPLAGSRDQIRERVEARLGQTKPEVDVLLVEMVGGRDPTIRLFIDHPKGVDHGLCAEVTEDLRDWLTDYGLEVSSPGAERPLTKPRHFLRFLGCRARVRTAEPIEGRRRFTGVLVAADEKQVSLATDEGEVAIPLAVIRRSNLAPHLQASQ